MRRPIPILLALGRLEACAGSRPLGRHDVAPRRRRDRTAASARPPRGVDATPSPAQAHVRDAVFVDAPRGTETASGEVPTFGQRLGLQAALLADLSGTASRFLASLRMYMVHSHDL